MVAKLHGDRGLGLLVHLHVGLRPIGNLSKQDGDVETICGCETVANVCTMCGLWLIT